MGGPTLKLILGNKNYSSWSLRPWIAMKMAAIDFEEVVIPIYRADSKPQLLAQSPAGKVPILIDGEARVWESLAIMEYLAEKFPAAGLWPADPLARSHARAISAEMHAGFVPLRRACPMNCRRSAKARDLAADALQDVRRIDAMWSDCRSRVGQGGPFLFGHFTAADAMYAPIVLRFETYAVEVGPLSRGYMAAIADLAPVREWKAAGCAEEWVLPQFEVT
jgi:glutathione S-transferase